MFPVALLELLKGDASHRVACISALLPLYLRQCLAQNLIPVQYIYVRSIHERHVARYYKVSHLAYEQTCGCKIVPVSTAPLLVKFHSQV